MKRPVYYGTNLYFHRQYYFQQQEKNGICMCCFIILNAARCSGSACQVWRPPNTVCAG
jgi:hypothetical protein